MNRNDIFTLIARAGLHEVSNPWRLARFARDVAMLERDQILRECQHAYSLAHCLELIRDRHYPFEDERDD